MDVQYYYHSILSVSSVSSTASVTSPSMFGSNERDKYQVGRPGRPRVDHNSARLLICRGICRDQDPSRRKRKNVTVPYPGRLKDRCCIPPMEVGAKELPSSQSVGINISFHGVT